MKISHQTRKLLMLPLFAFSVTACVSMDREKEALINQELDTRVDLAAAQLAKGNASKAIQTLRPALNRHPKNTKILGVYGLAHLALGNPIASINFLKKAYKLEPSGSTALNLSSAYIEAAKFQDSLKLLNQAIQKYPKYLYKERLYQNFGATYLGSSQMLNAIEAFEKALEINPTYYPAVIELAKLYKRVQEHQKSEAMWNLANGQCPQCFEPVEQLVALYTFKKRTDKAKKMLDEYIKQDDISLKNRLKAKKLKFKMSKSTKRRKSRG